MWLGYSWCRHSSASPAKRAAAPASSEVVGLGGGAATASSGPRTSSAGAMRPLMGACYAPAVTEPLAIVLIPGLLDSARLYAEQIPALWRFGPVTVADHTRDDSMAGIARRIFAHAPPPFAPAGLSLGGFLALQIPRQGPPRGGQLAPLDTHARPDTPRQRPPPP